MLYLTALQIADPPERWEALGFSVHESSFDLGGVSIELGAQGSGIVGWSLAEDAPAPRRIKHPNGAIGLDHVVLVTPDFDRTGRQLARDGLPLKRVRDAGGFRQGFRRIGPAILELVETKGEDPGGPARFWGLVPVVEDLDALKRRLGDLLSDPKPAVQPGRRIATLRREAGLGCAVAFMDPPEGRA